MGLHCPLSVAPLCGSPSDLMSSSGVVFVCPYFLFTFNLTCAIHVLKKTASHHHGRRLGLGFWGKKCFQAKLPNDFLLDQSDKKIPFSFKKILMTLFSRFIVRTYFLRTFVLPT